MELVQLPKYLSAVSCRISDTWMLAQDTLIGSKIEQYSVLAIEV